MKLKAQTESQLQFILLLVSAHTYIYIIGRLFYGKQPIASEGIGQRNLAWTVMTNRNEPKTISWDAEPRG